MKGQCIPRMKGNKIPSPMTLLERFREAVLRLMMFSAISKATNNNRGGGSGGDRERQRRYSPYNDPHHSEAVADCIEFIKKKSAIDNTIENSPCLDLELEVHYLSCNT